MQDPSVIVRACRAPLFPRFHPLPSSMPFCSFLFRLLQSGDTRDDRSQGIRHGAVRPQQPTGRLILTSNGMAALNPKNVDCHSLPALPSYNIILSHLVVCVSSWLQVHHILYLFAELGDRETTETAVRRVLEKGYGTDFYAGERGMYVIGESYDREG